MPESITDNGRLVDLEDVIETYRRSTLGKLDYYGDDLEQIFNNLARVNGDKLTEIFEEYGYGANYVSEYVNDETLILRTNIIRKKKDELIDTFEQGLRQFRVRVEEMANERMNPEDIRREVLSMVTRFEASFDMPNPSFIEEYMVDFEQFFFKKYNVQNEDLKYDLRRQLHKYSDDMMDEFFQETNAMQRKLTDDFEQSIEQVELGLRQKEEAKDKMEDPFKTDENVFEVGGKSQEQLATEKQEQINKIMSDDNLTPEEKEREYDKVSKVFDDAIAKSEPVKGGALSTAMII